MSSLTKSAFGSPARPGVELRLENTQNLVSTNVPEAIESLRATCNGIGIAMAGSRDVRGLNHSKFEIGRLTRGCREADYLGRHHGTHIPTEFMACDTS